MKGVILAGGTGSRLRPITHTVPKQLVPVANVPVLIRIIEDLREAGITDIGIVLGNTGRDRIMNALKDGSALGVDVTYIVQGEPLGLAHAVGCSRDFVGDDPFVVFFGDTVLESETVADMVESYGAGGEVAMLGVQEVADPTRYGVVETDGDDIVAIHEKPDDPPSDYAYVGAIVLSAVVFQYIETVTPSWRGELELTDVLHELTSEREVRWELYDSIWMDVGTPEDVIETNRLLLEEHGGSIDGVDVSVGEAVEVIGPVALGANVELAGEATIGPYVSIGDGCEIKDSTVRNSVLMEGCTIECPQIIRDSLIGPSTTIDGAVDQAKNTHQLLVGEDSRLHL